MYSRLTAWIFLAFFLNFSASYAQQMAAYHSAPAMEVDNQGKAERQNDYQFFLEQMENAGFGDLLSRDIPFTIFLPGSEDLQELKTMDPAHQQEHREGLAYHIVAGAITASDLLLRLCSGEGEAKLTTLQGATLRLKMEGTDILLIDRRGNKARITRADIRNEHSVIHRVDRALFFL